MSEVSFEWVSFYKELANKLLEFRYDRKPLVEIVYGIYDRAGIKMPTLERGRELIDIDPFTFFGIFNKDKVRTDNKVKMLKAVAELCEISSPVPTSFDGVPGVNKQNATFYYFIGDRAENDIEELWQLFEAALAYSKNPLAENKESLAKYFNLCINKKGNANSKITMALYWIAPNTFLNLDRNNEFYIFKSGKIPSDVVDSLPEVKHKISFEKYFEIVEKIRVYLQSESSTLKDFKELSYEAWKYSEEIKEEKGDENVQEQEENESVAAIDGGVDYWIYSPGEDACHWDEFYNEGIMALYWDKVGDYKTFNSKNEMKEKLKEVYDSNETYKNIGHAIWQFANEMKPGDIVFVKKGRDEIIGRGVVQSDSYFDSNRKEFKNVRKVNWTHKGSWECPEKAPIKVLTNITQKTDYVRKLSELLVIDSTSYNKEKFLKEVYMDEKAYESLVRLLKNKKNVILQGAPGVGKTYAAQRLAYSIMGVKDKSRVMMVQFHQSYSYEDFIMGYRPNEQGFKLETGAFYNFCKEAEVDSDNEYFFIIDEINRGNLSKIFGELFMLIENDKRGVELRLLYSDEKFSVPKNVYIIGMMNTADRSLAMLDYALRRRFAFFEMKPGFKTDGFREYRESINNEKFDSLINCVENLNKDISKDESLGDGFCIGHSYFCNLHEVNDEVLEQLVEYELIPLLKEYWFDEPSKVKDWSQKLRSAIK